MPPETAAVNVTAAPAGDGTGCDVEMPVNLSCEGVDGEDGGIDGVDGIDGAEPEATGYGMLPFEFALSYASAVLLAFRTHTATRYALFAVVGVHVQVLLDAQSRLTTQLAPS
jgi:hypothetical protein